MCLDSWFYGASVASPTGPEIHLLFRPPFFEGRVSSASIKPAVPLLRRVPEAADLTPARLGVGEHHDEGGERHVAIGAGIEALKRLDLGVVRLSRCREHDLVLIGIKTPAKRRDVVIPGWHVAHKDAARP